MAVYFLVMGIVFPDTMSMTEKRLTSPFFVVSQETKSISSGESFDFIIDTGIIPPAPTEENPEVYINTGTTPNTQGYVVGEDISYNDPDGEPHSAIIVRESEQYNSVHHYEDDQGVTQDFTLGSYPQPFDTVPSSWIPVTYRDRIETKNDELKQIVIVKPSQIQSIVSEFKKLMNQRL